MYTEMVRRHLTLTDIFTFQSKEILGTFANKSFRFARPFMASSSMKTGVGSARCKKLISKLLDWMR